MHELKLLEYFVVFNGTGGSISSYKLRVHFVLNSSLLWYWSIRAAIFIHHLGCLNSRKCVYG